MGQDSLTVKNVNNYYDDTAALSLFKKNRHQVLTDINLTIHENEFFGLVGESGCGKSTLGKAILGLIKYEGDIEVDGIKKNKKNRLEYAKKVQAVFQDPAEALNPRKTIGYTMEEPLRIHGVKDQEERRKKVLEMLNLVGLDDSYIDRYPGELSGGQRQRVCIGASLMLEPKLIIADEAVSALDVSVSAQILNLFQEIHEKKELSLLFISHNLNVVYYLCNRIAVMYKGQIVEMGDAKEIYDHPKHPYTRILLTAIPDIKDERESTDDIKEAKNEKIEGGCAFYDRCPYASEKCKGQIPVRDLGDGEKEHVIKCVLEEENEVT